MIKEKIYELKKWKRVVHTTWNPNGPGVIRIHMVPPKFSWFKNNPAIALLNGQDIVPLNTSWAVLLTEFIDAVNEFGPNEMSDEELKNIIDKAFQGVKAVYPSVSEEVLEEDLNIIVDTFEDIARGRTPKQEIGILSIGEYAPNMTAPHRMDLMISAMTKEDKWNCNQKCVHCYAAGQKHSQVNELSTDEWKKIIAACEKAKIPQLTFTGGEPTMRKDLVELVKEARWFVTRLNTNGVLLTKQLCKELKEAELDSIQVTFYSKDANIHNTLVGAANYEKTLSGIKNALEEGINLSTNTPLCSLNKDYVETLKFLHDLGVRYVTCSGLIITGNATKEASVGTQLSSDEIYEIVKEATQFCYENGMEISFTSPGWIEADKLSELNLTIPSCGACLSNMAITPDGKVIPCQSWLSWETLGDMRTDSFKKIWNSKQCKKNREFSAKMEQVCPLRGKAGNE
ncbi:MAG: radical SAM protein [Lachnospiraceae bacterium]|nr:radical SAM protein [Lachnospiraceae bacterium]